MLSLSLSLSVALATAAPLPIAPPRSTPPAGTRVLDAEHLRVLRTRPDPTLTLPLPEGGELSLRLERTSALAAEASVVVATRSPRGVSERPAAFDATRDLYTFSGVADGHPEAVAFVAETDRFVAGFVRIQTGEGPRTLWISTGPDGRDGPVLVVDPALVDPTLLPSAVPFCHADELGRPASAGPLEGGIAGEPAGGCRELLLAIDTDVEYTANLFGGDEAAAAAYAIALTAATSEIVAADLDLRLRVRSVRLWVGDDPWDQGNTVNQLFQYRDWWVANETKVERDLGHFLSGRPLGGGVAWLPGLCWTEYAFALSANLGGSFPYPLQSGSNANWDLMVFAHELGHNLGAPHTHSYDPPLDGCGNGDCSQASTGTIMSYCHTCPGGLANISLSFHPGNVTSILETLANAQCLPPPGKAPAVALDDYVVLGAGSTGVVEPLVNDAIANCESIELLGFDATTANGAAIALDAPDTVTVTLPADAEGLDTFGYSIVDANGSIASATVVLDVRPLLASWPVFGDQPGVVASYHQVFDLVVLPDFGGLVPFATDVLPAVDFPSTDGPFATSGLADDVAVLFEGWVRVPTTGFYTFFVESDDGSRLVIGDQVGGDRVVVSNDGLHGMVEKSGVIGLAAGAHPVRIEFFERGGGAGCIARLAGPGIPKQAIPTSMWSHGGTVGADLDGDGLVGPADLALLLGAWGTAGPQGDLNGDGSVGAADLSILLGAWGQRF